MPTNEPKWTVRKRQWPNGRVYWVVGRGQHEFVAGKNGGFSKFYDRSQATDVAKEMNGVSVENPVLEDW